MSKCLEFGFINGKLDCDVESDGSTLPPGSYLNSCGDCHVVGFYVWCSSCMSHDGKIGQRTQLDYRGCKRIGNQLGELVCEDHNRKKLHSSDRLPKGTYLSSCNGCSMQKENTRLSCERCSYGPGRWKRAWIDVHHCDAFSNDHGKLMCSHLTKYNNKDSNNANNSNDYYSNDSKEHKNDGGATTGCGADDARVPPERPRSTKIGPMTNGMPKGSYHGSCAGCTVAKDIETILPSRLTCSFCWGEDNHGPSSISLLGCLSFSNRRGHLVCETEYPIDEDDNDDDQGNNGEERLEGSSNNVVEVDTLLTGNTANRNSVSEL